MGKRGGKRANAGRKRVKESDLPVLSNRLAIKLHADPSTEERWQKLRDNPDIWLKLAVEKYIWDRAEGKPVQPHRMDTPVEVNVNIRRVGN